MQRTSEASILLIAIGAPVISLILILVSVSLNQRGGPMNYTNSYDSNFYHELFAVVIGYSISFIITVGALFMPLSRLGRKQLILALLWLALIMTFWRYQGMSFKSLDCGAHGYSSTCTYLIPNKLDDVITAVVIVTLLILSAVSYGWLRIYQGQRS